MIPYLNEISFWARPKPIPIELEPRTQPICTSLFLILVRKIGLKLNISRNRVMNMGDRNL